MLLSWSDDEEFGELLVGDTVLQKRWAQGLSFVGKDDRCTFCFTSSYGQVRYIISFFGLFSTIKYYLYCFIVQSYNRASGSLYHMNCSRGKRVVKEEDMSTLHSGAVRLFSPDELLHIFGFPDSYSFPDNMTTRQKYRAIGQSINKIVVQMLMHSELCRYSMRVSDDKLTSDESKKRDIDAAQPQDTKRTRRDETIDNEQSEKESSNE